MAKFKASSIGYRTPDGGMSDTKIHEGIMAGVDDTPHRIMSAQRIISTMGYTREEAEELFSVKLPDDPESA